MWTTYEQISEVVGPIILGNKEYLLLGYETSPLSVAAHYTVHFSET